MIKRERGLISQGRESNQSREKSNLVRTSTSGVEQCINIEYVRTYVQK